MFSIVLVVTACSFKPACSIFQSGKTKKKLKFGVCVPNYGETLSVDSLRTLALEAEKLEYDSVWTTDHILMPENSGTPYERIYDSIATLAYLAPQTSKVKLGI